MRNCSAESERELLPLSWLAQYGYCPRRCALLALDQVWNENEFTAEGRAQHQRVHTARVERRGAQIFLYEQPVFSRTLRPGRPALALDLMEELRAPLCDRLAMALINRGQITPKSFEQLTPPVVLTEAGRKTVISAWQKRKQETILHPFLQETIPIGLIAHTQAQLLARVLRGELDDYPPFHWR